MVAVKVPKHADTLNQVMAVNIYKISLLFLYFRIFPLPVIRKWGYICGGSKFSSANQALQSTLQRHTKPPDQLLPPSPRVTTPTNTSPNPQSPPPGW